MKIAFSSVAAPSWTLSELISQAASLGYDGLELRGLRGDPYQQPHQELMDDPAAVRNQCREAGIELVCLSTAASLDSKNKRRIAEHKSRLAEFITLADRLECRFLRLPIGRVSFWDRTDDMLARVTRHIIDLLPALERSNVTLLIENGQDVPSSEALWFVVDGVDHSAVKCCWNQVIGSTAFERPTLSLPRLSRKLSALHLADAKLDPKGAITEYTQLGTGDMEIDRQIEILRGLLFDGYLIVEWPKLSHSNLADAETILPGALEFLKEQLAAQQVILSAYKNDKHAPNLPALDSAGQSV